MVVLVTLQIQKISTSAVRRKHGWSSNWWSLRHNEYRGDGRTTSVRSYTT